MFRVKLHSFVNEITNSSTVIYTYMDNCVTPMKELIETFARTFGIEASADDMFSISVLPDKDYIMDRVCDEPEEYEGVPDGMSYEATGRWINDLFEDVAHGRKELPEWAKEIRNWNDYEIDTELYLVPKDEKYGPLGEALIKLLRSPQHEACQDG